MRSSHAVLRVTILTLTVVVALAGLASAQAIGQIFGKVTDQSGGLLPGVTVTVSGTGLQQQLTAVTATNGSYTFASVPIGTYAVAFELSGFKKAVRDVILTTGFNAMIDVKLELGTLSAEVNVTDAPPVVDTRRTTTGGTFSNDILTNIPTGRDPFQIMNMAAAVTLSGVNVGGSASGQQLTPAVYGTSANVQWNIEGGNVTDMASNSASSYFNFDSLQELQVVTGGGDVSVQSSGLFINVVTKSGSNMFKGGATLTFENAAMQGQNITEALFTSGGSNGTGLSGQPINKIAVYAVDFGGPIKRDRLWFWGAADFQDINVGVTNFFNTSDPACVPPPSTFARLNDVQKCLVNDQTIIQDLNGKVNYQLNTANRVQFLFTTDNKIRDRRGADPTTAPESTVRQYSPYGWLAYFTPQLTHTLLSSDKLVFTNQMTYVAGSFSTDFQDYDKCGKTVYGAQLPGDQACQFYVQSLSVRNPSYLSRGPNSVNYSDRPTWEVKSDATYFLKRFLGGEHSLKMGVGWREARTLSFTHYGGGVNVTVQCVGNVATGCGNNQPVAVGSGPGIVPYQAVVRRDQLNHTRWMTWSSYLQDSYSRGRVRINGGVRQDWQTSKFMGGCVAANMVVPTVLPGQCQEPADPNHPFNNFSPRVSATYDLFGDGKTALHGSYSYYFETEVVLASGLSNLSNVNLTWGPNQNSGACSTTANAPCWNDANRDNFVQANELIGTPTANTGRFDPATGILSNVIPVVDPNVEIGRTREAIGGVDREIIANLHAGVEVVYRKYDHGTTTYNIGYQPGCSSSTKYPCAGLGFPLAQIYSDRVVYTDPTTGTQAAYYTVCQGCARPSGAAGTTITGTDLSYQTYKGFSVTVEKRMSHRWQMQSSYTFNNSRGFFPYGSFGNPSSDPTGVELQDGQLRSGPNGNPRHQFKLFGSFHFPFGLTGAGKLDIIEGNVRTRSINGPGQVYGGTTGTISRTTLNFEPLGTTRVSPTKELDLSVSKTIKMSRDRQRVTLTLDCFNVLNVNTVRSYSSNNLNSASYTAVSSIIPPRVFRLGVKVAY